MSAIKVVTSSEHKRFISGNDAEMDKRAVHAVKSAMQKAEICKKPIAKYDVSAKRAYVEYANGEKRYVE